MPTGWIGSDRRDHLPKNWPAIRRAQLDRDNGQCTHRSVYGDRCLEPATDVHHLGDRRDHTRLTSLCSWHHDEITNTEAANALHRKLAKKRERFDNREARPGKNAV